MKFGICCGPGSFAKETAQRNASSVEKLMTVLVEAGADYVEFACGALMADDAAYEKLHDVLAAAPLKVEAFNSFIPPQHRITGPDVNLETLVGYATTALARCKSVGAEIVVLGSGGARKVPDGFDRDRALEQFVEFGRAIGPVAQQIGIDIAIEPLNKREDNLINSVVHGAQLVEEISQPRIQLLADLFHMFEDGESLFAVEAAGKKLVHTHVADLGRVAPGYAAGGEANFTGFFRALKASNYNARCSFEGSFDDIALQSKPLIALLKNRWAQA